MAQYGCFCPDCRLTAVLPCEIRCRDDGDTFSNSAWDLMVLTAEGAARLYRTPLHCKTLLVPEEQYSSSWQVKQLVSYGLSSRSTLTLSSMDKRAVLCVQRRIYTCSGAVIEEGERFLPPAWNDLTPSEQLLLAGAWIMVRGVIPK